MLEAAVLEAAVLEAAVLEAVPEPAGYTAGGGAMGAAGGSGTKSPSMPHAYSEVSMENHKTRRVW